MATSGGHSASEGLPMKLQSKFFSMSCDHVFSVLRDQN